MSKNADTNNNTNNIIYFQFSNNKITADKFIQLVTWDLKLVKSILIFNSYFIFLLDFVNFLFKFRLVVSLHCHFFYFFEPNVFF